MTNLVDTGLTWVGRFLTIGKILFTVVGSFGVAWGTAEYVGQKHFQGLKVAIEVHTSEMSEIRADLRTLNEGLRAEVRTIKDEKAELAREIAVEVVRLQGAGDLYAEQLKRIEADVQDVRRDVRDILQKIP